jgi:hypothetical protein
MTDKTIKLSTTGRAVLMQAATQEDRLVPPPKLPIAAARQVVRSLVSNGLTEEAAAATDEAEFLWRTGDDAMPLVLRATDAGISMVTQGTDTMVDKWSNRIEPASPALIALVEQIENDAQVSRQSVTITWKRRSRRDHALTYGRQLERS